MNFNSLSTTQKEVVVAVKSHARTVKTLAHFFASIEDRVRLWPLNRKKEAENNIRVLCRALTNKQLLVPDFLALIADQTEAPVCTTCLQEKLTLLLNELHNQEETIKSLHAPLKWWLCCRFIEFKK